MTARPDPRLRLALARAHAAVGLPVVPDDVPGRAVHRHALALAVELGAPLAPVLATVDDLVAADDALVAAVRQASAEARAVAVGLVAAPPVLGSAAAALVADDPWAWLALPAGRTLLLLAGVMWAAGVLLVWSAVRRAARPPVVDDEVFVLAAIAVRAGEPVSTALRRAGLAAPPHDGRDAAALALWLDLGAPGAPPAGWGAVGAAVATAVDGGVPVAPLLEGLARREREAVHRRARERAARLGARLSLPTALLLLPAGLLVAAGPLLLSALSAVS